MASLRYPFTQDDLEQASRDWGCNCGPAALAFVLQKPLAAARYAIRGFEQKRYTSPTMMGDALAELGVAVARVRPGMVSRDAMFDRLPALVRVQFTGPWTAPGANPRWAYGHTHWIATWEEGPAIEGGVPMVFDVNGGALHLLEWENEVLPDLLRATPRGDGGWRPTHIWRIGA